MKTTKRFSQNIRCLGRNLNWTSPEYKAEILPTETFHSSVGVGDV
jgi:hypothetical protein